MSPTAAAVAKIVKPGMKLTEVRMVFKYCYFPLAKMFRYF